MITGLFALSWFHRLPANQLVADQIQRMWHFKKWKEGQCKVQRIWQCHHCHQWPTVWGVWWICQRRRQPWRTRQAKSGDQLHHILGSTSPGSWELVILDFGGLSFFVFWIWECLSILQATTMMRLREGKIGHQIILISRCFSTWNIRKSLAIFVFPLPGCFPVLAHSSWSRSSHHPHPHPHPGGKGTNLFYRIGIVCSTVQRIEKPLNLLLLVVHIQVFIRWVARTRHSLSRPPSYNTVTKPPRYRCQMLLIFTFTFSFFFILFYKPPSYFINFYFHLIFFSFSPFLYQPPFYNTEYQAAKIQAANFLF